MDGQPHNLSSSTILTIHTIHRRDIKPHYQTDSISRGIELHSLLGLLTGVLTFGLVQCIAKLSLHSEYSRLVFGRGSAGSGH